MFRSSRLAYVILWRGEILWRWWRRRVSSFFKNRHGDQPANYRQHEQNKAAEQATHKEQQEAGKGKLYVHLRHHLFHLGATNEIRDWHADDQVEQRADDAGHPTERGSISGANLRWRRLHVQITR